MRRLSKSLSNERGIAMVLELVLVVLVLAVAGYTVYAIHQHNASKTTAKSSTSTTAASATADSSCLSTYHDANLCHFAANSTTLAKEAYTATITVVQSGQTSTMTLKSDGKGDTALSGTSNGSSINTIELAGATYLQSGSEWIEYPSGTSAPTTNPTSSMNIGVGASGISYKALGTVACGSLTCFKYQVTDSSTPGTTQYAWFDNKSYLLRQWQESDGSGNSTDMTLSYQAVTISAPSPVVNFSTAVGQ